MATELKSIPSMGGTTLPVNAGSLIRGEEWGIDNTPPDIISQCMMAIPMLMLYGVGYVAVKYILHK